MTRLAGLSLLLLLSLASAARADAPEGHGAYASFTIGNGRIEGPDAIGHRGMRWRSLEARAGRDLLVFDGATSEDSDATLRLDIVHYNEGHPDNNHRDGFAAQLVLSGRLAPGVIGEIGGGPYSSMNTTVLDGVQIDDAARGRLYTAALRLPLPQLWTGTELRIAVNRASVPGAFRSTSLQFGIGRHFGAPPPYSKETAAGPLWGGLAYGHAITNLSHTNPANGVEGEVRRYLNGVSWSVKLLHEGDDGVRVDRDGVAAQAWLVQPLTNAFTMSYGAGPYWARNHYLGDTTRLMGLFTVHLDYSIDKRNKFYLAFSRVKTYTDTNDRDLFHIGLLHSFGG